VQDSKEADFCSQMFGIGSNGLQGFSSGVEEDIVDHLFVLIGNRSYLIGDGEHDVEVGAIEQLGLTILDPLSPSQRLAFGAMTIPAGVEAVAFMVTPIAAFKMTAEGRRATHFDCGHDTPLFAGHRRTMLLSKSFAIAAEHIRHFQLGAIHRPAAQKC
jgi:hypothetical protein